MYPWIVKRTRSIKHMKCANPLELPVVSTTYEGCLTAILTKVDQQDVDQNPTMESVKVIDGQFRVRVLSAPLKFLDPATRRGYFVVGTIIDKTRDDRGSSPMT